ncbi:MAG TPA: cell division protein FtsH, partial [Lachnospiraceae bacterium]|nr:cell division protein FtsH [Lachnospiraceae bacterium]
MKEVKNPRRPMLYYWGLVLLILLVLNIAVVPLMRQHSVREVGYNTFISMTDKHEIKEVEIQSNQILFTDANGNYYKTGLISDENLVDRLYQSGAEFKSDIQQQMSPALSLLLSWVIPIVLFLLLSRWVSKRMNDRMGGGANSMMFGMGKSNARVYVQSTEGIHFSDVAGEDEAKENLTEIVDYLHNPNKFKSIGASMPKGVLLVGPPGTGKTMLAKA